MRVGLRIPQFGGDSILEFFRYEVLQALGFFVNLVPSVIEKIVQELFEQTMMTAYFESALFTSGGQTYAVMFFVFD